MILWNQNYLQNREELQTATVSYIKYISDCIFFTLVKIFHVCKLLNILFFLF